MTKPVKPKVPKHRNAIARDLHLSGNFKPRIVTRRKTDPKYNRRFLKEALRKTDTPE